MSIPAALGCMIFRASRDLPGLRLILGLRWAITYSISRKLEWGTASGTSSCSLSQTGYPFGGCTPPSGFTNVDDVTQDHAHVRA